MSELEHHVEVRVVTTAGVFPAAGFEREPADQPVARILERTRRELHITDTNNWIAVAGGHRIDPNLSYAASHLGPRVEIDWGPDHGAGGRA